MFWSVLTAPCCLVSVDCSCLIGCKWLREDIAFNILPILQQIFACLSKTVIKALKQQVKIVQTFFISHLATLRPTLGRWQGGSSTHPMLITALFQVRPEDHREPHNEVGSQSVTERISGIYAANLPILSVTSYPTA